MTAASASHRLLNLVQSTLLLGLMAALAWVSVTVILGPGTGLLVALGKLERRVGRFWEDIFLPGRRIPEPSLLRTHPPVESRIARLRALAPSRTLSVPPMAGHAKPALTSPQAQPRFRSFGFYWQGSRTADGNARKPLLCKVNQWRRLSFRPFGNPPRFNGARP